MEMGMYVLCLNVSVNLKTTQPTYKGEMTITKDDDDDAFRTQSTWTRVHIKGT